jgi:hypothetical protein
MPNPRAMMKRIGAPTTFAKSSVTPLAIRLWDIATMLRINDARKSGP